MVLTQQAIRTSDPPRDSFSKVPSANMLTGIAITNLLVVLKQLGELSEHASDIFAGLLGEATKSFDRVVELNHRISRMDNVTTQVEAVFAKKPASSFYDYSKAHKWARVDALKGSLFTIESQPKSLQIARVGAVAPPSLSLLDPYTEPKKECLKEYSNPMFFFEQWLAAEQERQKKLDEERKLRKEKKAKKKKPQQKQQITVSAVSVKTYSAMGKEFEAKKDGTSQASVTVNVVNQPMQPAELNDDNAPAPPQPPMQSIPEDVGDAKLTEEQMRQREEQRKAAEAAQKQYEEAMAQYEKQKEEYMRQQQKQYEDALAQYEIQKQQYLQQQEAFLKQQQAQMQSPRTVSPAAAHVDSGVPEAPDAPEAPAAPPEAPEAPVFNVPDIAAPTAPTPAPGVTNLLADIRKGTALKSSAAAAPPPPSNPRGGLLDEIRSAKNKNILKKAEPVAEKPKAASGGLGAVMDILARRQAIAGSDESGKENSGDEWADG